MVFRKIKSCDIFNKIYGEKENNFENLEVGYNISNRKREGHHCPQRIEKKDY